MDCVWFNLFDLSMDTFDKTSGFLMKFDEIFVSIFWYYWRVFNNKLGWNNKNPEIKSKL